MAGYIGKSTGITLAQVRSNSVETVDIQNGAVTATKLEAGTGTAGYYLTTNGTNISWINPSESDYGLITGSVTISNDYGAIT
jgi:hypothetical protein